MFIKAFLIWLLIATAGVLHSILRVGLFNRLVGDHRARQIGVLTGSGIIFVIAWFFVPRLGASTVGQLLGIGSMAGTDTGLRGRFRAARFPRLVAAIGIRSRFPQGWTYVHRNGGIAVYPTVGGEAERSGLI